MDLPDVNILINAFRSDLPHHSLCRDWIEKRISDDSRFGMSTLVLSSFIRIVTNQKIFRNPNTTKEALSFSEALTSQPNVVEIQPGRRHWKIFTRLCRSTNLVGYLIPDAYFAALTIEHSCRWVTLDADFRMFEKLDLKILDEKR